MAGPYPFDLYNEVKNTDDHKVPVSGDGGGSATTTTLSVPNRTAINAGGETVLRTVAANGTVTFCGAQIMAEQTTPATLTVKDSSTSSMAGNDLVSPIDTTLPESDLRDNGVTCTAGLIVSLTTPAITANIANGSTTMTVTATSIVLAPGQIVYIPGETSTRIINSLGTSTGGTGTVILNTAPTQTLTGVSVSIPATPVAGKVFVEWL